MSEPRPLIPDEWAADLAKAGNIEIDDEGRIVRILPDPPSVIDHLPQFEALTDFAKDIGELAAKRSDGELLTMLQRLHVRLQAENGEPK